MRIFSYLCVLIGLVLTACGGTPPMQSSGHGSRDALDWPGTYRGLLPCAGCPGKETSLTLDRNSRYRLRIRFPDGTSMDQYAGEFHWHKDGRSIQLLGLDSATAPTQYLVQENRLVPLDQRGHQITGASADHVVLQKTKISLEGQLWELFELRGKTVTGVDGAVPNILFSVPSEGRVSGHSGCNRFSGGYKTGTVDKDGLTSLSLSQLISTRMACVEAARNALEQGFTEALLSVDSYRLYADSLELYSGGAVLLRFEPVNHESPR